MKLQGHRWRTLRAEYKAQCRARNAPCFCGNPIDYDAPPQSPMAFEIDHIMPRSTHPDLAWETTNWRPSHCSCNRKRGNQPAAIPSRAFKWAPAAW